MRLMSILLLAAFPIPAFGQWEPRASGTNARLRGVSTFSNSVAWASGTKGTFVRTTDGEKWQAATVPGAEDLDFRDVHAFDADSALLLSIGDGEKSRIYRTDDGGKSWSLRFLNRDPKIFLDALAMFDRDRGLVLGDPVDGKYTLLSTRDGGKSWSRIPPGSLPPALPGEGAFAASGTCLAVFGSENVWFGTGGGSVSRVFRSTDAGKSWTVHETPIRAGNASSGVFSLAFRDADHGVAVGGDYKSPELAGVVALTSDGGRSWRVPKGKPPGGYRSAVAYLREPGRIAIVAVGPTGSDVSVDDGETWRPIEPPGYHAVNFAGPLPTGWAVGEDGRIATFHPEILTAP